MIDQLNPVSGHGGGIAVLGEIAVVFGDATVVAVFVVVVAVVVLVVAVGGVAVVGVFVVAAVVVVVFVVVLLLLFAAAVVAVVAATATATTAATVAIIFPVFGVSNFASNDSITIFDIGKLIVTIIFKSRLLLLLLLLLMLLLLLLLLLWVLLQICWGVLNSSGKYLGEYNSGKYLTFGKITVVNSEKSFSHFGCFKNCL